MTHAASCSSASVSVPTPGPTSRHALIAREAQKLANALNYMVIVEEVLAQAMLGRKAKLLQQLLGCRRICQRQKLS